MPKVAKDPHKHAGAKAADPLGTSPKPSTAVVGTATVVARPGRLSFKDGQTMVSTEFNDDYFGAAFTSCRNGPGKKVIIDRSRGSLVLLLHACFISATLGPWSLWTPSPQDFWYMVSAQANTIKGDMNTQHRPDKIFFHISLLTFIRLPAVP